MGEFYSRIGSASLIKEVTANTPLTPNTFFHINEEDVAAEYGYTPAMPVSGNRVLNLRPIRNKVSAPQGTISINVEPKTWGHFLNGVFGGVTSGNILTYTVGSGHIVVGDTITGGTSAKTATVAFVNEAEGYLLCTSPSGNFTAGETITGTGGGTGTVGSFHTTAYGHVATLPDSSFPTYTVQFNYLDTAVRYFGVRFTGLDAIGQSDNVITAGVKMMAQGQFRAAKITEITTSGAGGKTLTMDQTLGLVAGDTIKLYRPGTGFLDFSTTGAKTHTVGTVPTSTTITITNLETATAVGDLIMLAAQTPSYTIGNEFTWIGGSLGQVGSSVSAVATGSIEDFTIVIDTEFEERHSAAGTAFKDLFPSALLEKSHKASGTMKQYYQNESNISTQRLLAAKAFRIKCQGDQVGSTGIYNQIWFTFPEVHFDPYQTNLKSDEVMNEDVPFTAFYNTTLGYFARSLLVNDVASYA